MDPLGDRVGQQLAALLANADGSADDSFEVGRLERHRRFHGVLMLVMAVDEHEGGQRLEIAEEFSIGWFIPPADHQIHPFLCKHGPRYLGSPSRTPARAVPPRTHYIYIGMVISTILRQPMRISQ